MRRKVPSTRKVRILTALDGEICLATDRTKPGGEGLYVWLLRQCCRQAHSDPSKTIEDVVIAVNSNILIQVVLDVLLVVYDDVDFFLRRCLNVWFA